MWSRIRMIEKNSKAQQHLLLSGDGVRWVAKTLLQSPGRLIKGISATMNSLDICDTRLCKMKFVRIRLRSLFRLPTRKIQISSFSHEMHFSCPFQVQPTLQTAISQSHILPLPLLMAF